MCVCVCLCVAIAVFFVVGRFSWLPSDPLIIAEILFAVANVLSFARTTYVMPSHELLGPLQISLGRMFADIARFIVLFLLVRNASSNSPDTNYYSSLQNAVVAVACVRPNSGRLFCFLSVTESKPNTPLLIMRLL